MIRRLLELQAIAWRLALRVGALPITTLFSRQRRHLAWRLADVCFGGGRPGVYPEVALGALVARATTVELCELPADTFNVTEGELLAIAALTRRVAPSWVFEVGTADGRTTRNLARNVPEGARVFTLNLPLEEDPGHRQGVPIGARFLGTPEAARIEQLLGNSRTYDYGRFHGRCQVIFVDADHSEAGVVADSETALALVDRARGLILWHDALRFGVQTALPRLARERSLPIHLVAGTNVALLAFAGGEPVAPEAWARALDARAA